MYICWTTKGVSEAQQLIADSGAQRPTPKMLQRDSAQRYDRYFIKTKTTKIRKQREQNRVLYEQNRGLFVQTTNRNRESRMEFGINNNKENQNKKVTGQQSFEIVKQKNNRITEQTRQSRGRFTAEVKKFYRTAEKQRKIYRNTLVFF